MDTLLIRLALLKGGMGLRRVCGLMTAHMYVFGKQTRMGTKHGMYQIRLMHQFLFNSNAASKDGYMNDKKFMNHKEELKYEGAYREVCRMASLLANVMSGHVIDSINSKVIVPEVDIKMDKLEEILTISQKLYDLSPSTLSEHDDFLNEMRRCLDGFSESLGVPVPSPIICYDQSLYESRLRAIDVGKG